MGASKKTWLIVIVALVVVAVGTTTVYLVTRSSAAPPVATINIPISDTGSESGSVSDLPDSSVSLKPGQTFQVEVGQSDGPISWQLTTAPDSHVVTQTAQGSVGSCPQGNVGCRVPALYTYTAENAGSTELVWQEKLYDCGSSGSGTPQPCVGYQKTVRVSVS